MGLSARARALTPFAAALAAVLLAYLAVALRDLTAPGVYMDAVNPDYLVVRILNWNHAEPLDAWVLPGSFLASRLPVLTSLYHGLNTVWFGLPFYALFGTGVAGVRLTHMVFAASVLIAALVLLRAAAVPLWLAALAGMALAIDPAFVFAFRTQGYITLAPTLWLFLSLALALRAGGIEEAKWRQGWLVASGACFGLSTVGYFVFAFYLPVVVLAALAWTHSAPPAGRFLAEAGRWIAGVALGASYYLVGYFRLVREVGVGELPRWYAEQQLNAFNVEQSLLDRLQAVASYAYAALTNAWNHAMMFGPQVPAPLSGAKLWLLLVAPVALLAIAELTRRSSVLLRALVGLPLSFFLVSLLFGARLGGHHFTSLVPVVYVALAAGFAALLASRARLRPAVAACAAASFVFLGAANLAGDAREFAELERTGGKGYLSQAINRLAADLEAERAKPVVFFPDWGLELPVIMLTGGTVPAVAKLHREEARASLCIGRGFSVAAFGADNAARFARWADELGVPAPRIRPYRERDGTVVLQLATYEAPPEGCRVTPVDGR